MAKKSLDDLTEIEMAIVQQFIKTRSDQLGIESVQLFTDGAFVVFKD